MSYWPGGSRVSHTIVAVNTVPVTLPRTTRLQDPVAEDASLVLGLDEISLELARKLSLPAG